MGLWSPTTNLSGQVSLVNSPSLTIYPLKGTVEILGIGGWKQKKFPGWYVSNWLSETSPEG